MKGRARKKRQESEIHVAGGDERGTLKGTGEKIKVLNLKRTKQKGSQKKELHGDRKKKENVTGE